MSRDDRLPKWAILLLTADAANASFGTFILLLIEG
jgi:hypothetical protein